MRPRFLLRSSGFQPVTSGVERSTTIRSSQNHLAAWFFKLRTRFVCPSRLDTGWKPVLRLTMTADAIPHHTRHALRKARLQWGNDDSPGITRRKAGKSWDYFSPRGKKITDERTIGRINKLAIPPAWTDVWICPSPRGHIQAVGRDARGRKQYKYHDDWRSARDEAKYDHVIDFAKALPRIRKATARHLRQKGVPREKVLAAVVRVMEKTLIRVGNDEYARNNQSFGLTTLRDHHARVHHTRKKVVFTFRGKSGIQHEIDLADTKLAEVVKRCQDLPGQELFQYEDDDGQVRDITSSDVNAYLREITGEDFTAKDFRTWAGTVLAAKALRELKSETVREVKRNMVQAIETVAERLGNTKAVCRKCYIHPAVLQSYIDGDLAERLRARARAELKIARKHALDEDEASVLRMLEKRL
jgi:DNA topoisomerase-1